jgi:hypothetical protein
VYVVEAANPEIVKLVPLPVYVVPPGDRVIVQLPVAGKPVKLTLPVLRRHVGCVIVPTVGAAGIGAALIVIALVGNEVHGPSFVTVQVYVFGVIPERVNAPPDQTVLPP